MVQKKDLVHKAIRMGIKQNHELLKKLDDKSFVDPLFSSKILFDKQVNENAEKNMGSIWDYTDEIIQSYNEKLECMLKIKITDLSSKCYEMGELEVSILLRDISSNEDEEYWKFAFEELKTKGYELMIIEPVITEPLSIEEQMAYKLKNIKVRLTRTIVKLIAEV